MHETYAFLVLSATLLYHSANSKFVLLYSVNFFWIRMACMTYVLEFYCLCFIVICLYTHSNYIVER